MRDLGLHKRSVQVARSYAVERGLADELTQAERVRDENGGFFTRAPLLRLTPEAVPKYRVGTLREWLQSTAL